MNTITPRSPASTFLRVSACVAAALVAHATFGADKPAREETRVIRDDGTVRTQTVERVKLKNPDRNFVEKVARMSMEEAEISRVAAERTSNPRVRAFAEAMASDHANLSKELSLIASDKGVVLPAKDTIGDKWLKRDAKSFDLDYLKKMVSDHEDTVQLFQKQARDGQDPELVAFARKHLAALQHHLQEASDLHKMMK